MTIASQQMKRITDEKLLEIVEDKEFNSYHRQEPCSHMDKSARNINVIKSLEYNKKTALMD